MSETVDRKLQCNQILLFEKKIGDWPKIASNEMNVNTIRTRQSSGALA